MLILDLVLLNSLARAGCPPTHLIRGYTDGWKGTLILHLGQVIAPAGDIDRDGYADFLVSGFDEKLRFDDGRVVVYSGRTGGVLRAFFGEHPVDCSDRFGYSVASAGDVNADGYPDLVIGAPRYAVNRDCGYMMGRVYVFSGKDNDTLFKFDGEPPDIHGGNSEFGSSVSVPGDVNGDGHDDVLVGAHWAGFYGAAYMYSGADGHLLYKLVDPSKDPSGWGMSGDFGFAVTGTGDLDGDGHPDIAVSSPNHSAVAIFSGIDGHLVHIISGESWADDLGGSLASAGDVNGDGVSDLLVGAWVVVGHTNETRAYLYSGRDFSLLHTERNTWGASLSGVGDLDGDGSPDFLTGFTHSSSHPAGLYAYSGRTGNLISHLVGDETKWDWFGWSVSGLGDVNGDGHPEIATTAYRYEEHSNGWYKGAAYVYSFCQVEADVLPGQCPNYVSLGDDLNVLRPTTARVRAAPQLTAAFVGSVTLDVTTIDPKSALLEGVAPISWEIKDVTAPSWTKESPCDCSTRGPDGYPDLVLHFDLAAVNTATHKPSILSPSSAVNLTALLNTGEPIIGRDCLRINPLISILAGVDDSAESDQVTLSNAPNPFNASTTISYRLTASGPVRLDVYDVLGRHVVTLVDAVQSEGTHEAVWEGRNEYGETAASGVYFYRLHAGQSVISKKMILLK